MIKTFDNFIAESDPKPVDESVTTKRSIFGKVIHTPEEHETFRKAAYASNYRYVGSTKAIGKRGVKVHHYTNDLLGHTIKVHVKG